MKKPAMQEMTSGSPVRLLLHFVLPMTFGLLFQQLYNMADTVIVGKFLGVEALAGVGSTSAINFMVLGFCNGSCTGFAIPMAQKFGARDYRSLRQYVINACYLTVVMSLAAAAVTCSLCTPILRLVRTDPEFFQEAYDYIFVLFLGLPMIMGYNLFAAILRALGDAKTVFYFLLACSGLNIVLDLAAVLWLGMGVEGPAWATVISQTVAGICCFVWLQRHYPILRRESAQEYRVSLHHIRRLCRMGPPMGLQCSLTALGAVAIQSAINSLGTAYVAATSAGDKVYQLISAPLDALSMAEASFAGQNLGACRLDRVRSGVRAGLLLGGLYTAVVSVLAWFYGTGITVLFLDTRDPRTLSEILPLAQMYQRTLALGFMLVSVILVLRLTLQGMGFSGYAVLAGVCEMASRLLVALVVAPRAGYPGICLAAPVGWVAASLFLWPCYRYCMRRMEKRFAWKNLK